MVLKSHNSSRVHIQVDSDCNSTLEDEVYVTYKKRYLMLGLFAALSMSNAACWGQFATISVTISAYYNVPMTAVNWLSMIYMLLYIPFILPATSALGKYGLRKFIIAAATLNLVGGLLKLLCVDSSRFWLLMVAQSIQGLAQIFTLGLPSKIAATWFPKETVSIACAIGVFGNQVGCAVGLFSSVYIVPSYSAHSVEEVEAGLRNLFIFVAVLVGSIWLGCIFFFEDKPATPPSRAQALFLQSKEERDQESHFKRIWGFISSKPTLLMTFSYGISTGVFYAVSTLMAQQIVYYYGDGYSTDIGNLAFVLIFAGMGGALLGGYLLDRFGKFRLICVGTYGCILLGLVFYILVLTLAREIWLLYVATIVLGFFLTGYLAVGFEFASELSYPLSEDVSSGILNMLSQVFGIFLILVMGAIMDGVTNGVLISNMFLLGLTLIGFVATALIPEKLARREAGRSEANPNITKVEVEETPVSEDIAIVET